MANFIIIVKAITQFFIAMPTFEKWFKAAYSAIGSAILAHDQKKFQADLEAAAKKAEDAKDTSELESLMGKK
jgi:hypothetical protein